MEGQAGLERLIVKQSGLQEEFFCPKSPKLMYSVRYIDPGRFV